jgi:hypothetical protein
MLSDRVSKRMLLRKGSLFSHSCTRTDELSTRTSGQKKLISMAGFLLSLSFLRQSLLRDRHSYVASFSVESFLFCRIHCYS